MGVAGVTAASGITGVKLTSYAGALLIAGSVIGSLFPDIDHRGSFAGKKARVASWFASKLLGHRGPTHAPIVMTALTLGLYLLSRSVIVDPLIRTIFIGFIVGVMSHIILDSFTVAGVPFLYPLTAKKYSLLGMQSGRIGETVVGVLMVIGMILLIVPPEMLQNGIVQLKTMIG